MPRSLSLLCKIIFQKTLLHPYQGGSPLVLNVDDELEKIIITE
jgi:hypothetical protein